MTNRQKRIHQHAINTAGALMYENVSQYDPDGDERTYEAILENGLTFEMRTGSEGPGNWTRFEGYRLSKDDMEQARKIYHQLLAGTYYP